jgi:hypothetical protein
MGIETWRVAEDASCCVFPLPFPITPLSGTKEVILHVSHRLHGILFSVFYAKTELSTAPKEAAPMIKRADCPYSPPLFSTHLNNKQQQAAYK